MDFDESFSAFEQLYHPNLQLRNQAKKTSS